MLFPPEVDSTGLLFFVSQSGGHLWFSYLSEYLRMPPRALQWRMATYCYWVRKIMAPSGRQEISLIFFRSIWSVYSTVLECSSCFNIYWLNKGRLTWSKHKLVYVSLDPRASPLQCKFPNVAHVAAHIPLAHPMVHPQFQQTVLSHGLPPQHHLLLCRRAFSGHRSMPYSHTTILKCWEVKHSEWPSQVIRQRGSSSGNNLEIYSKQSLKRFPIG